MTRKTLRYDIDIATRDAARSVRDLAKEAAQLDDTLEQVGPTAADMAREIRRGADLVDAELEASKRAATALRDALGDVDRVDVAAVVQDLRRVGITLEDIEASADDLADSLRRAADVRTRAAADGFDDLADRVSNTRSEMTRAGDASRGLMGNLIGDSADAAIGIGGVGEALGQMTEAALEGHLRLSSIGPTALAAGGALAAVVLAFKGITDAKADFAAERAFETEQIDAYKEAIIETGTVIDGVRARLEDKGGFTQFLLGEERDFTEFFLRLGVSADDLADILGGGQTAIDRWADSMRAAGIDADDVTDAAKLMRAELHAVDEATRAAAVTQQFLRTELDDVTAALQRQAGAAAAAAGAAIGAAAAGRSRSTAAGSPIPAGASYTQIVTGPGYRPTDIVDLQRAAARTNGRQQ